MPSKQFALEPDGPKRLDVRWDSSAFNGSWRNIVVSLDGRPIGTIPNGSALAVGQTMTSPDGSVFFVRSARGFAAMTLYIERNGAPLPGLSTPPLVKIAPPAGARRVVFVIVAAAVVVGVQVAGQANKRSHCLAACKDACKHEHPTCTVADPGEWQFGMTEACRQAYNCAAGCPHKCPRSTGGLWLVRRVWR